MFNKKFDVIIVGGGPAGLAAAVALTRSRRSVVVVDSGAGRNRFAEGAHNLLGNEGIAPAELRAKGRAEAEAYGAEFVDASVEKLSGGVDDFAVVLDNGSELHGRRIILATGLTDVLPEIPGLREHWGVTALHCPFCHGYEARDSRMIVLGMSPMSGHQALMFSQLSDKVTYLTHEVEPDTETAALFDAAGIAIHPGRAESIAETTIRLEDGGELEFDNLVVSPNFVVNSDLYLQLGGELEEGPMGIQIPTEDRGRTPVAGVWAAGNNRDLPAIVVAASAQGVAAGAEAHLDLMMADLQAAK